MGLNEYLVNGYNHEFLDGEGPVFIASPDPQATPLRVFFRNCSGAVLILGIDENSPIFKAEDCPDLKFMYLPDLPGQRQEQEEENN